MNIVRSICKEKDLYYLKINQINSVCPFLPLFPMRASQFSKDMQLQRQPCNSSCPHFNLVTIQHEENKIVLKLTCGSKLNELPIDEFAKEPSPIKRV